MSDTRHLRASHIKPWRDATNAERLNGSNGLLLSPPIDHLFDQATDPDYVLRLRRANERIECIDEGIERWKKGQSETK